MYSSFFVPLSSAFSSSLRACPLSLKRFFFFAFLSLFTLSLPHIASADFTLSASSTDTLTPVSVTCTSVDSFIAFYKETSTSPELRISCDSNTDGWFTISPFIIENTGLYYSFEFPKSLVTTVVAFDYADAQNSPDLIYTGSTLEITEPLLQPYEEDYISLFVPFFLNVLIGSLLFYLLKVLKFK